MGKKQLQASAKQWRVASFMALIATVFIIFISLVYYNKNHKTPVQIKTSPAKPKINNITGGGAGSEQYNEDLKKYGSREAQKAEQKGKSYIPPVIKERKEEKIKAFENLGISAGPVSNMPVSAKAVQEPVLKTADVKRDTQREQLLKAAVLGEINQISGKFSHGGHKTSVFEEIEPGNQSNGSNFSAEQDAGEGALDESNFNDDLYKTLVKPGDIFYAVNNQTLNSDVQAGVGTATILSGKLKDARVLGTFVRQNEHLVLVYTKLVMPDGTPYSINGYAVDPSNQSSGVRTSVDHHYLERWGGLVAASFLEGFGQAVENSGTESVFQPVSGSVVETHPQYNTGEQVWIAAGKIGEKLAEKASNNFNKSPTVILNIGEPIGVLIIDIKKES